MRIQNQPDRALVLDLNIDKSHKTQKYSMCHHILSRVLSACPHARRAFSILISTELYLMSSERSQLQKSHHYKNNTLISADYSSPKFFSANQSLELLPSFESSVFGIFFSFEACFFSTFRLASLPVIFSVCRVLAFQTISTASCATKFSSHHLWLSP